ncbi:phage tail family protein [Micromonospora craniellae]|uniref:hypothetical protein n=1 Tax=Micromonospora craniellae TaxID=2294034 RepID=UPI0013148CE4|nr:hypothetical protein [Micromonospora craniellae]QOC89884.1 hypothetical protein ID554_16745 [Micromonospora craniellae]
MPALVGSVTLPPLPPPLQQPSLLQLPVLSWATPAPLGGSVVPLSGDLDRGWHVLNIDGLGSVPRSLTTAARARGGSRLRNQRLDGRSIILSILIWGDTEAQFVQRWWELEDLLCGTDVDRPGVLSVLRPGQSQARVIDAYYASGFDGEPGAGILDDVVVVTLTCPGGLFRAAEPVTFEWKPEDPVDFFDDGFPAVSADSIGGEQDVTNVGKVDAWPDWTIIGPADGLTAAITTNGVTRQFVFTPVGGALEDGAAATITTDPRAVLGPNGENWTAAVNWATGRPWPIPRGTSRITFTAAGVEAGKTRILLAFHPQFRVA